jgi:tRNA threonylcarbamoyladenosine biosynthesis protein TsaB
MKILAIDTSTEVCSAALMVNEEVFAHSQLAPRQHAQLILPMIDKLLSDASISLSQLSCLAFSAGPGSFTGIRIATGVIQGLSYAVDLPVVPISTLAVLAQGAYRQFSATNILSALDARMKQVYWGVYKVKQEGVVESVCNDSVVNPENVFVPKSESWTGIGSGWDEYSAALQKQLGDKLQDFHIECHPLAQDILPLAEAKFAKKEYVSAAEVLPVYLREKVV